MSDAREDTLRLLRHDLKGLIAGLRAMARQMADTERLWASSEGPEYARALERSAADALETLELVAERLGDER